jgi:cytochrome oxidase Cu insertion factor (SCO1/SenC/PrrC family)
VKRAFLIPVGVALGATVLIVLVYFSWNGSIRTDRADLPRYGLAPEFDLKDQDGMPLDKERLRGKIWVADFVDLADSGASALLCSRFAELDQNFRKGEQLRLISMVLPPVNQTEPSLAEVARRYLASPHWRFLDATPERARNILDRWKPIVSAQADGNLASHFFLVDSEGVIRGLYDGHSPETVQRVLEDVGTLLRGSTK